ncbi:midasin-like protein [Aphelenchoides avenae]|nr:midasin-like protein [Aphelenchus avenae]
MATELLSTLKQDVVYVGEDDEQKEKQQGRALFDRQKQFALVVKTANECGLSSRRGLAVNSERLTQQLLSEIVADKLSRKHPKTETLTRLAAASRNVVQKLLATANMHLQEHIQKQVSVQTIGHLRGITEYGLHWLHSAVTFADRIADVSEAFRELSDGLGICAENYKGGYKTLNHRVLTAHYAQWRQLHEETSSLVSFMSQVVAACPSGEMEDDDVREKLTSCRQIQGTLGPLTKGSDAYAHLTSALSGVTHLLSKCGDELLAMECCGGFWRGEQAVTFVKVVKKLSHELSAVASDGDIASAFPEQSSRMTDIAAVLSDLVNIQPLETMAERYPTFSSADALVVLQDFYKKVVAKVHEAEQKPMDAMKCLVELVNSTGWSPIIASIEKLQRSLTDHVLEPEDLLRARDLSCGLSDILEFIIERVVLFLDWFATFYLNFESVSAHLLRKGFVNPIPKVDNSAEGQGKELDGVGDENCGMGEGEGAKDVSDEIEESGQLEGLKGDDEQQADGRSEPMKDSEKPIEMEEDFAADLENIDADDNDKGDDDNEEGGEENADWNVGDVEEPEDRQLDPELWEKPKEDSQRNLDEENKGAQNETDEMAAKEEESNAVKEQEQAEKPTAEGHEQEETKDVDGEELDAMENVNEINLDDADSDHEENIDQHQDTNDEEAADGEAPEDEEGSPELAEQDVDDADERTSDDEKSREEESVDATAQEQMDEDKEAAEHAETDTSTAKQDNVQAMESESKATSGERDADVEQENREEFTDANEGNDGDEETDRSAKSQKHQLRPRDETNKDAGREEEVIEDAALEADQPKTTAADENIDVEMGDVEPTAEEEDLDENSDKLAHIGDQEFRPQDKHVVKKSTVEEALSTRSQFDRMKNKDTLEKVHRDKEVNGGKADNALDETEANEVPTSDRTLPSSMINMNFEYELTTDDDSRFAFLRERLEAVEISASERKALESKWAVISDAVSTLSFELAENLRIILEPTVASKLQGDYRTGKRLNMRRLVAYIASDYRKNRIWMRRTKKAQRNYQICLAVDDSASMKENLMTEMTCEAVCLIERALRQLEVGELSICKFGKTVKVLSEFSKGFDESLGPRLLEDLSFEQDKTDLANLLGVMDEHFAQARDVKTSNQMLIILGDGRGVLADGLDRIRATLSRLMDRQVTVLYVIVDNQEKPITEMKVARFIEEPGQPGRVSLTPYMSQFPFPFYALIRSIASLPSTIAEAIRQWFEMTIRD